MADESKFTDIYCGIRVLKRHQPQELLDDYVEIDARYKSGEINKQYKAILEMASVAADYNHDYDFSLLTRSGFEMEKTGTINVIGIKLISTELPEEELSLDLDVEDEEEEGMDDWDVYPLDVIKDKTMGVLKIRAMITLGSVGKRILEHMMETEEDLTLTEIGIALEKTKKGIARSMSALRRHGLVYCDHRGHSIKGIKFKVTTMGIQVYNEPMVAFVGSFDQVSSYYHKEVPYFE